MSAAQSIPSLTSGRLLASNAIWNLLGFLSPMAVAVVAVPSLIRGLGVPRFGVLSLAWIVTGYFSLFDLGMGRALTKLVADKLGAKQEHDIPALVWTSLLVMLGLGVVGGLMMVLLCPWLANSVLKVPADLRAETLCSFYLVAFSLPLVTVTSGLRGILEALQRFRLATLIRIPMSVFSFAGPLLVLPFSHSLPWVIAILILSRFLGCVAHLIACLRAMPALRRNIVFQRSVIKPVLGFGGWMTASNVVNPILVYVDRFVIGALVSVSAIAYYTAPFDTVIRLTVIPGAIAGVLFPAFAVTMIDDPERTRSLLVSSLKLVFLVMFPITLVTVTFAPEGLRFWLGTSFSVNGGAVLRWLAAGVLINSLANTPFVLVQGAGRPDLTAKLHLVELPLYIAAVWVLTSKMGIKGTAIAWAARLAFDTLAICFLLERIFLRESRLTLKVGATLVAGLLVLCVGTLPASLGAKACFLAVGLVSFALVGWFLVLRPDERFFLLGRKTRYTQALH